MSRLGYVGFAAQLVRTKDGDSILTWSPHPSPEFIGSYDRMCGEMMEDMTESEDDWLMWWECRMDEEQFKTFMGEE